MLPRAVRDLTQELTRLPGVGPKTAQRLSLHLLRQPQNIVGRLAQRLQELHASVNICQTCFNLAEGKECEICLSQTRSRKIICVVEGALDVEAIERAGAYDGLYHVLGGTLSPLEGVGLEQLTLEELFLRSDNSDVTEIIIALSHTMEGEATARYIIKRLEEKELLVSRLAQGLPTGGDIEFADATTLRAALSGRKKMSQ